ncbi:hypothetical protein D477_019226 [Arthrobacter crystallopoietes BAB-32]|uniref:NAD(P)-binding domain-containing protein n=1 Tax=Arthrobacter crystallopoietes BAB-32 TaxID=1246476 RepID=N1UQE2_9MICC|nr:NAD(P)H-binding protein [Arthrobacter crystallopoietes]EMY32606.1 hypothetical protein D477_019226 [Arthrobacter crystallopoietes BAB-32]
MQHYQSTGGPTAEAPILVTGGTGTLGRLVVARLQDSGRRVRILSRHRHDNTGGTEFTAGDLASGEGIEAAVEGVRTIVHLAGSAAGDDVKARNLVNALAPAGAAHLVYISVVGADRIPVAGRMDRAMFGYFGSKYAAERIIAGSGIPYTTLRATQFHQLLLQAAAGMAKLPVIPVPSGFRFQPIDAADVADRLTDLALGAPRAWSRTWAGQGPIQWTR